MAELTVCKITLSSGKEVLIKPMLIKHQNQALEAVGKRAGDNQVLMGALMQQELIKLLLVQIDGEEVKGVKLEDLDGLFSYQEFQQVLMAINELSGGKVEDLGKYQIEHVISGGK